MADPQVEPAKKLKRTAIETSSSPQKPKVLKHKQVCAFKAWFKRCTCTSNTSN